MTDRSQEQEGKHVGKALPVMATRSLLTSGTVKVPMEVASSPASSASTSLGVKRISQPDSPQVSTVEQSSREECIDESLLSVATATKDLTEEEWVRSSGLASEMPPPYPLSLVGRVFSLTDKMVVYLHSYFLRRDNPASDNRGENRFRRKNVPSIGLGDYLQRICNYVIALEPPMILAVLAYAHILDPPAGDITFHDGSNAQGCHEWDGNREQDPRPEKPPLLRIDLFTVHRFVITSITLASKALGDYYYSNAFYAKVGGVSTRELNHLELDLALLLDWRLQVSRDTLKRIWLQLNA